MTTKKIVFIGLLLLAAIFGLAIWAYTATRISIVVPSELQGEMTLVVDEELGDASIVVRLKDGSTKVFPGKINKISSGGIQVKADRCGYLDFIGTKVSPWMCEDCLHVYSPECQELKQTDGLASSPIYGRIENLRN